MEPARELKEEIRDEIREELHYELNEVFLIECMKENLGHARHVENERMTFNSLFAALVGGSLAVISQIGNQIIAVTMIGILMLLNFICFTFTKRWNKVFKNHYQTAKKIYFMFLDGKMNAEPAKVSKRPDINRFYYFDNSLDRKPDSVYISTAKYFLIYNVVIFALLVCALCYFLK